MMYCGRFIMMAVTPHEALPCLVNKIGGLPLQPADAQANAELARASNGESVGVSGEVVDQNGTDVLVFSRVFCRGMT